LGGFVVRVNYQRDKRLKDLERQRKQEEKRQRRLSKDREEAGADGSAPETTEAVEPPGTEGE
jgi:hypothetical protein